MCMGQVATRLQHRQESHEFMCFGMQVALPSSLMTLIRSLVQEDDWPLEQALPLVTSNPAARLQLPHKGQVGGSTLTWALSKSVHRILGLHHWVLESWAPEDA